LPVRSRRREREVERVQPLAHFAEKLLTEQRLDIRLVIDNQHPYGHGTGSTIWRHAWAIGFVAMFFPWLVRTVTCRLPAVRMLRPAMASIQTSCKPARLTVTDG
jgi:hypothetical protein